MSQKMDEVHMREQGIEPLAWPTEWLTRTWLDNFLMGIPLIGLDRRVLREFRLQLKQRDESVLRIWGAGPSVESTRCRLAALLQEYLRWPNTFFVPKDPCDILFWNPSSLCIDGLEVTELLCVICEEFGIQEGQEEEDFLTRLSEMSFGELVSRLAGKASTSEPGS